MSVSKIVPRRIDLNRKHVARYALTRHKYAKSSAFMAYRIPRCSSMRCWANGMQRRRVAQVEHKCDVGARVFVPSAKIIATNVRNWTYIYRDRDRDGQVPELCRGQKGRGEEKSASANGVRAIRRLRLSLSGLPAIRILLGAFTSNAKLREPWARVTRYMNRKPELRSEFEHDSGSGPNIALEERAMKDASLCQLSLKMLRNFQESHSASRCSR